MVCIFFVYFTFLIIRGMLRAKETFDISYLPPCARSTPGLIHLLSSLAPCDIDNDSNSPSPKRVKLGEDK